MCSFVWTKEPKATARRKTLDSLFKYSSPLTIHFPIPFLFCPPLNTSLFQHFIPPTTIFSTAHSFGLFSACRLREKLLNIRHSHQAVFCSVFTGTFLISNNTPCVCACSFVWTKEPKATATRKSWGRPLVGLKRAPDAVLQAKRPRFPDGPGGELPPWRGFQ